MPNIAIVEHDKKCQFTVTMPSDEPVTLQILDSNGRDISQNMYGEPGPVTMTPDGNGNYVARAKISGGSSGQTVTFRVSKISDPNSVANETLYLDHDCPRPGDLFASEMPGTASAAPAAAMPAAKQMKAKPKPKPQAKPKPKAVAKMKAKPKAKKPAAKPKKAKPKAMPKKKPAAKAKKAKPAKKKPAAKKKRR